MGLEVGIVGLPNVGKSTLFKCITAAKAEVANYPFCTIEPNVGITPIPDKRIDRLAKIFDSEKTIPAVLKMVDIAGLVEGASKGEGLGNKFLENIRNTDAIAHVVRCFEDDNIIHVRGKVSPEDDINIIHNELLLSDLEQVERRREKLTKLAKNDKIAAKKAALLGRLSEHLQSGHFAGVFDKTEDGDDLIDEMNLLTAKPFFFVMNVSEDGLLSDSPMQQTVRSISEKLGVNCIKICCSVESEIADMSLEDRKAFLLDIGIDEPGLNSVIREGFRLLKQMVFFTAGKKEIHAWNVAVGSRCPQAAGKIHTDMEKGFIRSEIYHFDDIDKHGNETAVKEAGKFRIEGKEYVVVDGDILNIRFNV